MTAKKKAAPIKNIWQVAREYEGLAGSGGIKDVCRQLAEALGRGKNKVSVVLPLYGFMDPHKLGFTLTNISFEVDMPYVGVGRRERINIWRKKTTQAAIYLVDGDRYREKQGIYTYTAGEADANPSHHQGTAYIDYFAMNVLLQKATLALIIRLGEKPDVIHCHDGHTALLPAMMRELEGFRHYFQGTGAVVTIHNAGLGYHQEVGDLPFAQVITGLPWPVIDNSLLNKQFDPFLAAAPYAVLTAVSENYARELQETDDDALTGWLGHRLLTGGIRLKGVTNGINPADFNPARPQKFGLPAGFSPARGDLAGKLKCKEKLISEISRQEITDIKQVGTLIDSPELPLFTMISRLSTQKGLDILIQALDELLSRDDGFQMLIQGVGAREIENDLIRLAQKEKNKGRICILLGYNQALANQVYAAGDFFVIPSRYEPCGLTDYIAQLFGNTPIVHHVGGLVKVKDGITGLTYAEHSPAALVEAMTKALDIFRNQPERLADIRQQAVRQIEENYTWDKVMQRYLEIYEAARPQAKRSKDTLVAKLSAGH